MCGQNNNTSENRLNHFPPFSEKSLLTQLRDNHGFQVVYSCLATLVFMSVIIDAITYMFDKNALDHDISFLVHATKNPMTGVYSWILLVFVYTFLYLLAFLWIRNGYRKLYIASSTGVIVLMFVIPLKVLYSQESGLVVKFSFLLEQMRFFLKSVAFFIETVRTERRFRNLTDKKKGNDILISDPNKSYHEINECSNKKKVNGMSYSTTLVPSFKHFIYFSFVPTFIYRDSYPKKKTRDWKLITTFSFEFLCMIYILFQLQKKTSLYFMNVGKEPLVISEFTTIAYWSGLNGVCIFICIGIGMIHLWMNIVAEIMMFANRNFYDDWWMAVDSKEHQRKWNQLVQLWLYEYVYKVIRSSGGSRNQSAFTVLLIAGFCHDYVAVFAMGFFFPIFSYFYVMYLPIQLILYFTNRLNGRFVNVKHGHHLIILLFWTIVVTTYSVEYYSRQNCPVPKGIIPNSWKDFVTPRAFYCVTFN